MNFRESRGYIRDVGRKGKMMQLYFNSVKDQLILKMSLCPSE